MTLEMLGELVNAFCQQRYLNIRAACILLMKPKSIDLERFCFCHFLL